VLKKVILINMIKRIDNWFSGSIASAQLAHRLLSALPMLSIRMDIDATRLAAPDGALVTVGAIGHTFAPVRNFWASKP
jgi:hypothetical protein